MLIVETHQGVHKRGGQKWTPLMCYDADSGDSPQGAPEFDKFLYPEGLAFVPLMGHEPDSFRVLILRATGLYMRILKTMAHMCAGKWNGHQHALEPFPFAMLTVAFAGQPYLSDDRFHIIWSDLMRGPKDHISIGILLPMASLLPLS